MSKLASAIIWVKPFLTRCSVSFGGGGSVEGLIRILYLGTFVAGLTASSAGGGADDGFLGGTVLVALGGGAVGLGGFCGLGGLVGVDAISGSTDGFADGLARVFFARITGFLIGACEGFGGALLGLRLGGALLGAIGDSLGNGGPLLGLTAGALDARAFLTLTGIPSVLARLGAVSIAVGA